MEFWGSNEIIYVKYLEQYLAQSKGLMCLLNIMKVVEVLSKEVEFDLGLE